MNDNAVTFLSLVVSYAGTAWCWRRAWHSQLPIIFKVTFTIIAAVPVVGPFLYLFVDVPPRLLQARMSQRRPPRMRSAFLRRWSEREHVYLAWASLVFCVLAAAAYWLNDWRPGSIHRAQRAGGSYTDVDVIFFALLVGAVLTFSAALRIKVRLVRHHFQKAPNSSSSERAKSARRST